MKMGFRNLALLTVACVGMAVSANAAPPQLTADERAYFDMLKNNSNEFFRAKLQGAPEVVDGQTLHPKLQYHLEKFGGRGQPPTNYVAAATAPGAVASMRASVDRTWGNRSALSKEMKAVADRKIPGPAGEIEVRAYTPDVAVKADERLPVLVYFHGGGWLFASIEAVDPAMRLLANEARAIVVSANYRLTPENQYPAAQDDALATFRWVRAHAAELGGDPRRVGIGGDSAGGQMALVTSLRLVEAREKPPLLQLLYYPVVDTDVEKYPSAKLFGVGFGLDKAFGDYVLGAYFPDPAKRKESGASPIAAKSFKGIGPAIVATAGFDMLRDQGRALADRMKKEGITVSYKNYPSLIHGFMQHSYSVDDAEAACVETARQFGEQIRKLPPQ